MMPTLIRPCPTSPAEAVDDARARLRGVAVLLDTLHPSGDTATPLPVWEDRDLAWRETLLALARCIACVEHARDLESVAHHAPTMRRIVREVLATAADAPVELGAVS